MEASYPSLSKEVIEKDKQLYEEYLKKFYAKYNRHINYGTAGFRDKAELLELSCLRVGIFQGYCAKINPEKVLGITITASHNPVEDNGIKQSDFDGGMLRRELEEEVNKFVIEPDVTKALAQLHKFLGKYDTFKPESKSMLFVGRDTRPSSKGLTDLIEMGAKAVNCESKNFGELTTPMLHFLVKHFNCDQHSHTKETEASKIMQDYYDIFIGKFQKFFKHLGPSYKKKEGEHILIDCSNGIGGKMVQPIIEKMQTLFNVTAINTGDLNFLNDKCGAEFVHKETKFPRNSQEFLQTQPNLDKVRCLAFDGDADRIVYFLPDHELKEIKLLDGDKMISLYAKFFKTILTKIIAELEKLKAKKLFEFEYDVSKWEIGMVQTAYANGSSTKFLREDLKLTQKYAPNGVKNSHPVAHKFDIGIYCESNGHGTFTVKDEIMKGMELLHKKTEDLAENEKYEFHAEFDAVHRLSGMCQLFAQTQNQINGDAMTNFLCIEEAMAFLNMSGHDYLNMYKDYKCLNTKVYVKNKLAVEVVWTEDRITKPASAQKSIDDIIAKYPGSRAFARPSGTEDCIRVYVEADTMEIVKEISQQINKELVANKEIN